ncbi:MAG: nuclear transport factor 2 family protein [Pseudomonadota bacterium]
MTPADKAEALLRRYFDACNAADRAALVACFTDRATHWFPPGMPGGAWRGAEAIADGWVRFVDRLDAVWTVDRVCAAADGRDAVMEWSNWTRGRDGVERLTRGADWYRFDLHVRRITEVRAYFAAPLSSDLVAHELAEFDYATRGYPIRRPD